jgi:hypothetical protein
VRNWLTLAHLPRQVGIAARADDRGLRPEPAVGVAWGHAQQQGQRLVHPQQGQRGLVDGAALGSVQGSCQLRSEPRNGLICFVSAPGYDRRQAGDRPGLNGGGPPYDAFGVSCSILPENIVFST